MSGAMPVGRWQLMIVWPLCSELREGAEIAFISIHTKYPLVLCIRTSYLHAYIILCTYYTRSLPVLATSRTLCIVVCILPYYAFYILFF